MGHRLAEARRAAGLSQRALAKKLGVSKAMVSMLEGGFRTPRGDLLMRLARTLDVSAESLMPPPDDAPAPASNE